MGGGKKKGMALLIPVEKPKLTPIREYHQSEVAQYLKCGKQWEFRHVLGIKAPPRVELTVGRSVDEAITHNLALKVKSGADVSEAEVVDVCATQFDKEAQDTEWRAGEDPGQEKDAAIQCVKAYHKEIAPKVQPATVQERFVLETDAGYNLGGTIDLTTKQKIVADTKTSNKVYNEAAIYRAIQPTLYDYAYEALHGEKAAGFRYDIMIKPTKTMGARIQQVQSKVTKADRQWLFETIHQVHAGIQAGIALPAPDLPGVWWCSEKFCGYWSMCKGKKK
jgi:CRISPR/Cas system-associated exonuclease Cas4 (RecB family)